MNAAHSVRDQRGVRVQPGVGEELFEGHISVEVGLQSGPVETGAHPTERTTATALTRSRHELSWWRGVADQDYGLARTKATIAFA